MGTHPCLTLMARGLFHSILLGLVHHLHQNWHTIPPIPNLYFSSSADSNCKLHFVSCAELGRARLAGNRSGIELDSFVALSEGDNLLEFTVFGKLLGRGGNRAVLNILVVSPANASSNFEALIDHLFYYYRIPQTLRCSPIRSKKSSCVSNFLGYLRRRVGLLLIRTLGAKSFIHVVLRYQRFELHSILQLSYFYI
jgi:hypothetical protein